MNLLEMPSTMGDDDLIFLIGLRLMIRSGRNV